MARTSKLALWAAIALFAWGPTLATNYFVDQLEGQFYQTIANELSAGRQLVDVEMIVVNADSDVRYSGSFRQLPGQVRYILRADQTAWDDFVATMDGLDGRWLDFEATTFQGQIVRSGVFWEDGGENYRDVLASNLDEATFQSELKDWLDDGFALIDFESFVSPSGDTRYGALWVDGSRQPRTNFVYGLTWPEVEDLLDPLRGRIVDIERYRDGLLRTRYGIVLAMVPDGTSLALQDVNAADLAAQDGERSDVMVDLDFWEESPGTLRYAGAWGEDWKSLREIEPAVVVDPIATGPDIDEIVTLFESAGQGTMGLHGRNVRLGKSLGYREDEWFYLASSAKLAFQVRLWQLDQQGDLDIDTDTIRFGTSLTDGTPWYVEERADCASGTVECGLSSGACNDGNDLGRDMILRDLARGMMRVSDNAATSMLVDEATFGLAWDSLDVNTWLSSISGIGRGWGLLTSIQELDAHIVWQGQFPNANDDPSYFSAPRTGLETMFRDFNNSYQECNNAGTWTGQVCGCGNPPATTCTVGTCQDRDDPWGDLRAYLLSVDPGWPANIFPAFNSNIGHARYFNTGMNHATPRTFAELQKQFVNGELLDAAHTEDALGEMRPDRTDALVTGVPGHIEAYSKGGLKNGLSAPVSDTTIFRVGPDAVVVNVMTKDNLRTSAAVRNFWRNPPSSSGTPLGPAVLQRLLADLRAADPGVVTYAPAVVRPGQPFSATVDIANSGGVEATAFEVAFYATNDSFGFVPDGNDFEIGRVSVAGLGPGETTRVRLDTIFPSIPADSYWLAWWADPADDPLKPFGDVGEYFEGNEQLGAVYDLSTLQVEPPGPPCPDADLDGYHACDVTCDATGLTCGDCDDVLDSVNPAALDVCNGLDDDCDGDPNPGIARPLNSRPVVDPDPEVSDELGYELAAIGDLDGDGVNELAIAQPAGDSPAGIGNGVIRVLSGATRELICEAYDPDGDNSDDFGWSIAGLGDLNSDDVPEFVVGAPTWDEEGTSNAGAAIVFDGATCEFFRRLVPSNPAAQDLAGSEVAGIGDINLDGVEDIAVGVPRRDLTGSDRGAVFVFSGKSGVELDTWFDPEGVNNDRLGEVILRTIDLDGDLIDDVLVGAPEHDGGGAIFVFSGFTGDVIDVWMRAGANSDDGFGSALADLGDVNGDGTPDLLVGVPDSETLAGNNVGDAQILSGADGQPIHTLADLSGDSGDDFGFAVASAGDVDGDGLADAAVGAPFHVGSAGEDSGGVVVFSSATGAVLFDLEDPQSRPGERFGYAMAAAGDLTGDGLAEFIVGSPRADEPEAARAGRVLIWSAETDCDGDGATPFIGDCDDQDAGAAPDAVEVCDSVDNDCDALIDEDDDGDGFGVCDECDDADAAIYPGAPERCNGLDDDCDFDVDEGVDADLDGYTDVCDCNDGDDAINPDAADDVCDRIDADCNGVTDDGAARPVGQRSLMRSVPDFGEELATGLAVVGDLSGDGVAEIAVGIPGDDTVAGNAGAVAVFDGATGGLHCLMTDPDGAGFDELGSDVAALGDVTGDGVPDLVAGAQRDDDPEASAGTLVVFSGVDCSVAYKTFDPEGMPSARLGDVVAAIGDLDGDGASEYAAAAPASDDLGLTDVGRVVVFDGATGALLYRVLNINPQGQEQLGDSIAGGRDLDADGVPDFVIGGNRDSTVAGVNAGSVLVVSGASGTVLRKLVDFDTTSSDSLGTSVALIDDLDGDNVADILAGATGDDAAGTNTGAIVVFSGADGSFLGRASTDLPGSSERLGTSVVALPDIDGDGVADFAAGAPLDEDEGADTGSVVLFSGATLTAIDRLVAADGQDSEQLGTTLAAAPDLSGDGMPDIVAGAPLYDAEGGSGAGRAIVFAREADCDGDGVSPWGGDCDDGNGDAFGRPGNPRMLTFDAKDLVSWQPPAEPGGTLAGLTYDVLLSDDPADFLAGGTCDTSGTAATSASVPTLPALGDADFYLVRAENACAVGPAGTDSMQTERPATACP